VVRGGLKAVLTAEGIRVVAEAGNRESAVQEAMRHHPDVLVIDVAMDGGVTAIREVLKAEPGVTVLVFASSTEHAAVISAVRAGARGYIYKAAEPGDIVRAVLGVANGEAVFGPDIVGTVISQLGSPRKPPFPNLTNRERQVLSLVAQGLPNGTIARSLDVTRKTVNNHMSAIFAKLGVPDRATAIIRAREAGLG
jgi:DNA-binding NarL/FixJ family response regulator